MCLILLASRNESCVSVISDLIDFHVKVKGADLVDPCPYIYIYIYVVQRVSTIILFMITTASLVPYIIIYSSNDLCSAFL